MACEGPRCGQCGGVWLGTDTPLYADPEPSSLHLPLSPDSSASISLPDSPLASAQGPHLRGGGRPLQPSGRSLHVSLMAVSLIMGLPPPYPSPHSSLLSFKTLYFVFSVRLCVP